MVNETDLIELCTLHNQANVSTGFLVVNRGSSGARLKLTQIFGPNSLNRFEYRLFLVVLVEEASCGYFSVGRIDKLLPNHPVDTCLCQEEWEELFHHLPLKIQGGVPFVGLRMRC